MNFAASFFDLKTSCPDLVLIFKYYISDIAIQAVYGSDLNKVSFET